MKKQSQLILLGALAVGGYYAYSKGMFGKKTTEETTPEDTTPEETTKTGSGESYTSRYTPSTTTTTAVIDHSNGGNVEQSIEKAKQLVLEVKDLAVRIKTAKGQPNIKIAKKKKFSKKQKRRFDIKTAKRVAKVDCTKVKRSGARKRCEIKVAQAKKDIQTYMFALQNFAHR
jgi:hypothetical protein